MTRGLRPLPSQTPRSCRVAVDAAGRPAQVDGAAVDAVREEWRIEEGWWSTPCRRRCFALALADGRICTVYEDRRDGGWWRYGG
ncbi:MAG: hypothetical protein ACR2JV_08610 [Gaiellales bacterium]